MKKYRLKRALDEYSVDTVDVAGETKQFVVLADGTRTHKSIGYYRYFDTEREAWEGATIELAENRGILISRKKQIDLEIEKNTTEIKRVTTILERI